MRIDRRRFNQEEEIATTASAPDRHWPECGQHIWGKFNKRTRRTCSVTYLLDDDIDPSNTSDVRWGAAFPHPSPAPPKAMADPDSAVASVLHRTGLTPRPIVVGDGLLPRWATGEPAQRRSTRFTRSKSANES
jgi:hypothetical protein